jgi:hypothetical protein
MPHVGERVLFVSEFPKVYPHKRVDTDDLFMLATVIGGVRNGISDITETYAYLPQEWKGETPKPIHNRRVMKTLRPGEANRVAWPIESLLHNVLDSIGIGLYQLRIMNLRHRERGPSL